VLAGKSASENVEAWYDLGSPGLTVRRAEFHDGEKTLTARPRIQRELFPLTLRLISTN